MNHAENWATASRALLRAWQPLVAYELLISLVFAVVLGPLVATCTYHVIGLSGEAVLGNFELLSFLASPLGVFALVLFVGVGFALVLLEYAGLILLTDAALCGATVPARTLVSALVRAAPRLFGLALLLTALAVLVSLPFLGLGALAYWFLLSDADIHYFLAERPPRFWGAVLIAFVLGLGYGLTVIGLVARWALAVPVCVLEDHPIRSTLSLSTRLMRGRVRRLFLALSAWQVAKSITFVTLVAALNLANASLLDRFAGRLGTLIWLTAALVLADGLVLEILSAVFAVGLAGLLAYEYEQGRRACDESYRVHSPMREFKAWPQTGRQWRAVLIVLSCAGPLLSIGYAMRLEQEFFERRPVYVTAHRAGPKSAPENSLSALQISIAAGADYAEIDVQQTSDGQVVLMHDRDLRRMTGDPRNVSAIAATDLASLHLRRDGAATEDHVPTLAEMVEACAGHIRLNVELKDYTGGQTLVPAVLEVLRRHEFTGRAIISCLQLAPLEQSHRLDDELPVGMILSTGKGDMTRLPVEFLSLHQRLVNTSLVRRAHRRGMEVHAWGVSDQETALRMLDLGCDNLITDEPALLRAVVDEYNELGDAERLLLRMRRWMRE